MFNIRNLVNRISQTREGDASDNGSIRSRSESQNSNVFTEDTIEEAEGFLCPTCMEAFTSPDDLQSHYEKIHMEPGANYLCPVCRARLGSAQELEIHFSENHSISSKNPGNDDIDSLKKDLSDMSSALNEERWSSEELKKEMEQLQQLIKVKSTTEENLMYQQQLQGLQETKSLLTSEVVLLRKQLAEALESTLALRQSKERLEEKAAKNSQVIVQLQASLDENIGITAALQENMQQLEIQLEKRMSMDDAEMLKGELTSVQRMMDQMTLAKENERDVLQTNLEELLIQHEALKNELITAKDGHTAAQEEQLARDKLELQQELSLQIVKTQEVHKEFVEQNEQLMTLQRMREETDVCVVQLREEVTSLQDMLNQARDVAEGQVSAKEDELLRFKLELTTHQQQVNELESQNNMLKESNQELSTIVTVKEKEIMEKMKQSDQTDVKLMQLEEKILRLESERADLMITIEQGEGSNTVIQQLQQDNMRLQKQVEENNSCIESMQNQQNLKEEDWSLTEKTLMAKQNQLEQSLSIATEKAQEASEIESTLRQNLDKSKKDLDECKNKADASEAQFKEERATNLTKLTHLSAELEESRSLQSNLQSEVVGNQQKETEWQEKAQQLNMNIQQLQERNQYQEEEMKKQTDQLSMLEKELSSLRIQNQVEKEEMMDQVRQSTDNEELLVKKNQEAAEELDQLKRTHQEQVFDWNQQLIVLQKDLTDQNDVVQQLQERVELLQHYPEALEEEKLKHIQNKANWAEQEELLQGEKESMSTLSTHLEEQLKLLRQEHVIVQQKLEKDTDRLLQEKHQLTEVLNVERQGRRSDNEAWSLSKTNFEREVTELQSKFCTVEESSAQRNQRCLELETLSEKYLAQKIELETRLALAGEEKDALHNSCAQWENEVDRLKFNGVELRRRLEDSQAALHELGRENQSLQMENAKLQGRKWADDSEVGDCHGCQRDFTLTVRKHHCRNCGQIFCNECSSKSASVGNSRKPLRVCESCFKELNSSR